MASRGKTSGKRIETINPNAAGIDIGSERHYVAIDPSKSDTPVRSFGCYTPDLEEMAKWLIDCGVTTVAMESTGVYWIPVYQVLEQRGLEVYLVDARHVKNVPGRKTDVVDCQWIEQLHKVLSEIMGVTGMKIIRAILAGERRPLILAGMREPGVKKSEAEIMKALSGNYREEHLFTLKQALELYDVLHAKIRDCDKKIEECLSAFASKADPQQMTPKQSKRKTRRKNQPHFDLQKQLYRISGVDLTAIDGIDSLTAQSIISEVGFDLSIFASEKHFSSWLALSPENRITGGKVRTRRTRKSGSRVATALRLAAQSLHSSESALGAFFRRALGGSLAPCGRRNGHEALDYTVRELMQLGTSEE